MLGFSIGKLVIMFAMIYFGMRIVKSLQTLNARKNAKNAKKSQAEDVVDLTKDKDGKYK